MTNQLVLNRLYCVPNSLITRVEVGQNNTVAYWLNVRPRPAAPCHSRAPAPRGSRSNMRSPDYPPRGVVLPLLGVVDWSPSRATARPIHSAERARNRKARSHDRPWNHLAHRRIPPQDFDSVDHRNHPARHRRRSRDPGFSGAPCGRPAPLLLMTNLPSHQRVAELAEQKSAPFAMHEISRRDNYAAASAHRCVRWKKTSATGSPTGTTTTRHGIPDAGR